MEQFNNQMNDNWKKVRESWIEFQDKLSEKDDRDEKKLKAKSNMREFIKNK